MKKNKKLYLTIGFILISIPLLCASPLIKSSQNNKNEAAGYTKDIAELTRIVDVINIIENRFVGKEATPSKEELYKASITGIINKLDDPYSEYLSTEDLKEFSEDLEGEYVGVGMAVQKKKGEPMEVTSPFVGSPAEKVGIRIKDKIIKVDGKDILPLTATETTKMLKGKENTKVEIEITREGQKNPIKFTVTRAKIKLEMVESKMFDNKIGYVSLLRFGNNVGDEVQKSIVNLQSQGMKGLILDLRLNPGGSLQEAQDISSLFVKDDLIVSLKYKNGQEQKYMRTKNYLGNFPLVVLINKGSASASEIVTGVIKDYKRGTVIGETTFGKGIVQQVIPLRSNDAIKLTIAQYFTPKGNYIHGKGIEPDIKVPMEELIALKGYTNESEEAKSIRKKELEDILLKDKGKEEADKIIANGDVQLKRAIEEISKKIK
ncbi:MAG: S41 family peptidase [Leptotrichiaceae bacterium]|nr:S41 family peptidase [Leptotrichiaceae bacterium]MBP9630162.1 S41 family peptidase [Leptotrichiaceae bacterium]